MPRDRDDSKMRPDVNEIAFRTVQAAIGEAPKPLPPGEGPPNTKAVKRGRKGGKIGGKARAAALSPRRRKAIAKKASAARGKTEPEHKSKS